MTSDLKGYQQWQEKTMLLCENQMIISTIRMCQLFELAYVCRWSKIFFLRACIKADVVLTFLILGSILDP